MKTIYLISRNEVYLEKEIIRRLNFEIVLVGRGCFPSKTGIWMRWQKDDSNDYIYKSMDVAFALQSKGIEAQKGLFFPERWLWEDEYENILIFIDPDELKGYIAAMQVFSFENDKVEQLPDAFIYKFESESRNNKLMVTSMGFLYKAE